MKVSDIEFDLEGLARAIACDDPQFNAALREEAYRVKVANVGNTVYLRGLIEITNICSKDCLYCGIRRGNSACVRYELSDEQVLATARLAAQRRFGSVVIQGGERSDAKFIEKITRLLRKIKEIPTAPDGGRPLGITLSLGEQSREVYQEWFEAGAHRYLLRMESTNPDLYYKIHPRDEGHSYDRRLRALYDLKETGFQAGTGAMIGLPFQTPRDMARDLLFYKEFDAPMIGMGPYNPNAETPLTLSGAPILPDAERLSLGLRMIALLRLLMPDINIASATALEVLSPHGRELGILSGANIIMPNLTPAEEMEKYNLYNRKTLLKDCPLPGEDKGEGQLEKCRKCDFPFCSLGESLQNGKITIGYGVWGDSLHALR